MDGHDVVYQLLVEMVDLNPSTSSIGPVQNKGFQQDLFHVFVLHPQPPDGQLYQLDDILLLV